MTRKSLIIGGVLAILGVAVAAAGFLWLRPIDVTVASANSDTPVEVFGLGTTEAKVVSKVGFEAAGAIVELKADVGDRVPSGAVLARLNSSEQEAKVKQARASVSQQQAAVRQSEAAIERARAALWQKKKIKERRKELLARGVTSQQGADEAQAEYQIAVAEVAQAQSAADVARANVQQSQALLLVEAARLAKFTLRSPFDAVVIARSRELGATVNPGEAILTLVDPATTWVLAYVDEARAGRILVGQSAKITLRSLPNQQFHGRVARIQVESDRVNEEWRVEVTCDDCSRNLHLGEQAEVLISVAHLGEGLLVPQAAIDGLQENHGLVWTVEAGRLARRAVKLGERTVDGQWEVVSGLPKDAMIVTGPNVGLREGQTAYVAKDGGK